MFSRLILDTTTRVVDIYWTTFNNSNRKAQKILNTNYSIY